MLYENIFYKSILLKKSLQKIIYESTLNKSTVQKQNHLYYTQYSAGVRQGLSFNRAIHLSFNPASFDPGGLMEVI